LAAVAVGGTSNGPAWLPQLVRDHIVLHGHDADDAGDQAATRLANVLVGINCMRARPLDKDWNAMLCARGRDALARHVADLVAAVTAERRPDRLRSDQTAPTLEVRRADAQRGAIDAPSQADAARRTTDTKSRRIELLLSDTLDRVNCLAATCCDPPLAPDPEWEAVNSAALAEDLAGVERTCRALIEAYAVLVGTTPVVTC
jgi:DNA primase